MDGGEIVALLGGERGIERGAWGENASDFATDDLFGEFGVLHLLADGDAVAFAEQAGDVVFRSVIWDAAHGNAAFAIARGKSDLELAGSGFGVVEEELVEVAEAKKEQCVGILAFSGQVLTHERGLGVGGGFGHGRVRIQGVAVEVIANRVARAESRTTKRASARGGRLAGMRFALGLAMVIGCCASVGQTAPAAQDTGTATQTYTNADLHITFAYPVELKAMDVKALPGAAATSRSSEDPDAEANSLQTGQCSKVLLSVGETGAGQQGGAWGSILMTALDPSCIPPKALTSNKRMENLLMPMVTGGTQVLGMMPMGQASSFLLQGHKVYFAAAQGEPVAQGDLQSEAKQSIAFLAVQVNDHIVTWKIESNSQHLFIRLLSSRVDFGAGTPQALMPGRMGASN